MIKFTVKSILLDRVFVGLLFTMVTFFFIPFLSYFSMRQVQEVSITISITSTSFILLLISIFGGTITMWRDIERKYTFTVLSLPISRTEYLIKRFLGTTFVIFIIFALSLVLSLIAIYISSQLYKSELPILWGNIIFAFYGIFLKYLLVLALTFLFSSFSTSFFTPIFLTITFYLIGNSLQGVYDYVMKEHDKLSASLTNIVKAAYYIFPNLSFFDYTPYASYSLPLPQNAVIILTGYFLIYFLIIMVLSVIIINKRDFY